jgi:Putative Ig domain
MTRIFHPWSKIRNLRRRSGWRTGALSIGMSLVLVSSVNLATNAGIASAAANDFGTTTVGSSTDTGDGQSITCNRYAATTSGTVSSISVNVGNVDPASKGYSLAIYADASSNPSSLLGQATGTLTASSWNTLSVSASVTSGGFYWLCYNSNTTSSAYNNVRYASGTTPAIYKDQSYGTWPSPFGTVGARWTDSYSIYATVGSATQVAPVFTAASPPGATVGVAYTYTFTASGSPAPSFSVASGTLPSGLTLNSVSGVLSGNPTTAGTSTFTVKASNTAGSVTSASITLTTTTTGSTIQPLKLISRSVPAFASSGTPSRANDADYNTTWRSSSSTASLTYNLAAVPAANRSKVLLVWYNEATEAYDPAFAQESAIRIPRNYTIQVNSAPSGATAPTSGWTTTSTVTSNKFHSRQHVIDMTGANWIRLSVTSIRGGSNADINMDVYDASQGLSDDWIIYGSSTPSMAMQHTVIGNTTQSFSQIINAAKPAYFPVQENGSISGIDSFDGVNNINTWLSLFPGHYVAIALGANDADECVDPTTFYNNYVTMIKAVTNAGKVPVVPLFNWSKLSTVQSCGPGLIDQINNLYATHPEVVKGPDFWNYFKSHPELISSDNTHPTDVGLGTYRQMWADTMLANVYK